jgi:hypothetical protein
MSSLRPQVQGRDELYFEQRSEGSGCSAHPILVALRLRPQASVAANGKLSAYGHKHQWLQMVGVAWKILLEIGEFYWKLNFTGFLLDLYWVFTRFLQDVGNHL